jgi:hypothetical protein
LRIVTTALLSAFCLAALFDAGNAAADCYSAVIAAPAGGHYALTVQNRCKAPVALAVCWRWGGNASPQSYRLSRPGTVTFLGPEQTKEPAATTTWLRCANGAGGACRIDCVATAANAPVAPAAPAQPKPQQASLPPQPALPLAPPPPQWGAIAAGIDTALTGTTGHAGAGWALGDSADAASQTALDQCKRQGVVSCKIVDLYNEGCAYITTGNNGSGGYGWGTAATSERAVALCTSQGLACQKPIGGCVR